MQLQSTESHKYEDEQEQNRQSAADSGSRQLTNIRHKTRFRQQIQIQADSSIEFRTEIDEEQQTYTNSAEKSEQ
nr:hypothetical protein [Tanacetum cinerariifolium]